MTAKHHEMVEGEHVLDRADGEPKVALVSGPGVTLQPMTYVDVAGLAIAEGDIIIGKTAELEANNGVSTDGLEDVQSGVVIDGERYRWTDGVVPYEIRSGFSAADRKEILDAIAHWRAKTNLRFVARRGQQNYIYFQTGSGCSSWVGMQGGPQPVTLAPGCSTGNAIHEIGHAVGLWHEHTREDRDSFVTVNFANIQQEALGNFTKRISDGIDVGPYDYASIMHYPGNAFSKNGKPTIVPKRPGVTIGQRNGLSRGDIATVRWMYPNLEPSRSWQGLQFRGSIPANATRTWFTHSWPSHWYVDWFVMPTAPVRDGGPQLSLEVAVTRQTDRLAKYFLTVKNHTGSTVSFDARYAVLGWSRASRDEPSADNAPSGPVDGGTADPGVLIVLPADDGSTNDATVNGAGKGHDGHGNGSGKEHEHAGFDLVDAGAGPEA